MYVFHIQLTDLILELSNLVLDIRLAQYILQLQFNGLPVKDSCTKDINPLGGHVSTEDE